MSILLGPYDNEGRVSSEPQESDDQELFVFGYACKLFRDDSKGLLESSGQMLIPWMGDGSLMVDRYDIRNRLEDKSQFGLKPILPRRRTEEEEDLEELLDQERYLGLGVDILEHELLEEETKKRAQEDSGSYQAVGFVYKETQEAKSTPALRQPEHPPTSAVDVVENEEDRFVVPKGLAVPGHIQMPATKKLHSIIERTAGFVARQGTQMEIIIKAKQKHNPFFSFVSLYDPLHSYYRHLLQLIASGKYVPKPQVESEDERSTESREGRVPGGKGEGRKGASGEEQGEEASEDGRSAGSDSEQDSDEEGFELHPLLRVSTTPRSSPKPRPTRTPQAPPSTSATPTATTATPSLVTDRHPLPPSPPSSTSFFYAKSLTVNAAPSLDQRYSVTQYDGQPAPGYPRPSAQSSQQMVDPSEQLYQHPHPQLQYTDGHSYHHHHPRPSDFSSQHNLEAYYRRLSAEHISNKMGANGLYYDASPPPPPPDLQPIIDKTAEYVARNSEEFERTVLEKHCGDPKFGFLNPWNKYYPYYKLKLQQNKEKAAEASLATIEKDFQSMQREATLRGEKIQKLSQTGTVSFKLQPKKVTKMLETDVADFSPAAEEEEEEERSQSDGMGQSGSTLDMSHAQQHNYQARQEDGYTADLDSGQMSAHYQAVQDDNTKLFSQQSYPEEYVHYSSEGTYYYPSGNGEVEEEHGEDSPAAKRTKTDDGNTVVMDNKVQEFLSQVKAVLDT